MVAYLSRDIRNGDMDAALRRLQTFLSTIPQWEVIRNMRVHTKGCLALYSAWLATLRRNGGSYRQWTGGSGAVQRSMYVMELKPDKSADRAMEQIDPKNHPNVLSGRLSPAWLSV